MVRFGFAAAAAVLSFAATAHAAPPPDAAAQIDRAVAEEMAKSREPAVSIAVVSGGKLFYAHAYGQARLAPATPANTSQVFAIGSVTKQFVAASILMLAEEGKLKLSDPVGKWLPGLTAANRITVRQLLSHTSGYRDFWPQDYVMDFMMKPTTHEAILDRWAKAPLDFQPGDQWQYSNTGYVAAAIIVEKVSGKPLNAFLDERIFKPLGMASVQYVDKAALPAKEPEGYTRYGMGPERPAPKEGAGWIWGAGHLAMTPQDLAKWDEAMIAGKLLKPASWRLMQTSIRLNNGRDSGYGLGVDAGSDGSLRLIEHGGEVSGFLTENRVWPDQGQAVIVVTNTDRGNPNAAADRIAKIMALAAKPSDAQTAAAKAFFEALQAGRVDRAHLTPTASAYFDPTVTGDYLQSLAALGALKAFEGTSLRMRGGFTQEIYKATCAKGEVRVIARAAGDRYEQFQINPPN
jgi:CubicO group peptidase (beta-lactamase class C family)